MPQALDAISKRLVAARLNAQALAEFPGQLPDALADAYTIQTASISRWPDDVAGWKVGGVPEPLQEKLGDKRLSGPIFRRSIASIEPGSTTSMPIFQGGFAAVEAEFVLEVAETIEPTTDNLTDDDVAELIAAVRVGAEIASSPMAAVNILGPCCVVSDFGNNAGMLVGPEVTNWRSARPEAMVATVTIDNTPVGTAGIASISAGLLDPLRFLIGLCARRNLRLAKGTLVSCGALTGIHEVTVESKAEVDFGAFGSFNVAFEPMPPRT